MNPDYNQRFSEKDLLDKENANGKYWFKKNGYNTWEIVSIFDNCFLLKGDYYQLDSRHARGEYIYLPEPKKLKFGIDSFRKVKKDKKWQFRFWAGDEESPKEYIYHALKDVKIHKTKWAIIDFNSKNIGIRNNLDQCEKLIFSHLKREMLRLNNE